VKFWKSKEDRLKPVLLRARKNDYFGFIEDDWAVRATGGDWSHRDGSDSQRASLRDWGMHSDWRGSVLRWIEAEGRVIFVARALACGVWALQEVNTERLQLLGLKSAVEFLLELNSAG
jgi:hypothetical protein